MNPYASTVGVPLPLLVYLIPVKQNQYTFRFWYSTVLCRGTAGMAKLAFQDRK